MNICKEDFGGELVFVSFVGDGELDNGDEVWEGLMLLWVDKFECGFGFLLGLEKKFGGVLEN